MYVACNVCTFSLKTVGHFCFVLFFVRISFIVFQVFLISFLKMVKTCFIVYLFCGVNILLQNQIVCLKVGFYCVIIR